MNIQGWFPVSLTSLISLLSKRLSRLSSTTIWKYHFFSAQPSLWSNTHIHTWLLKKPQLWLLQNFVGKMISLLLICYLGLKAGGDWRQEEKGTTENEMTKWHYQLNGHDFEQAPGVGDGQGSLACCSPWGRKELNTMEQLNWTEDDWLC